MADVEKDFRYPEPPLVEVIAEVRWKLTPLSSIPNGGVDPYFFKFRDWLSALVAEKGFAFKEPLATADLPLEFLGGSPTIRFRPGAEKWPLFQVGPGLLSINITPPYEGWAQFRQTMKIGIDGLRTFFAKETQLFELASLTLHYIDAFTAVHGMHDYNKFVVQNLSFASPLPTVPEALTLDPAETQISGEVRYMLKKPSSSYMIYRVRPGKHREDSAALVEFMIKQESNLDWPMDPMPWFDEAHAACRAAFQAAIPASVKGTFGAPIEIGGDGK